MIISFSISFGLFLFLVYTHMIFKSDIYLLSDTVGVLAPNELTHSSLILDVSFLIPCTMCEHT